ncbi:MAG TPA: glycosyltransferase family 4 protein [Anaerolineae bacterium]|nr:glycosyltransferase family 4 protein [Anaerolineae bacterium]
MRIALIAPFAVQPKGTTRWRVLPLARALAEQGHAVRVVIPPYDWPAHSGQIWQDGSVQVVNVSVSTRLTLVGHGALAGRLVQAALAWQPDVVHCFKPKGHSGLAALLLLAWGRRGGVTPPLRLGRVPVVVDADDYEASWNHVLGYPAHWTRFFRWQERSLLHRAHAVTAASRWLADFAASLGQQRVFYLPNGVEFSYSQDTILCHPTWSAENDQTTLRVLLYTRFVEHSVQEVWQVWRQVLAAEPDAQLLIAGQGRAGEEHLLAQMAAEAGAGRSVQVLGWLPASARPGLFAAVDAAMLPVQDTLLSRAKSPMRLLDLLAAGVPVATQRVGEYGEIVVDGATGLVTTPGDPAALAHSVLALLRDPALRRRLGHAAREDVSVRFVWPALVETALAAYR